ncbi:GNAT family N-acetyltransferase [Nonomuraea bangladeshensis]|uniref:GNAT family N-acetyltransferase n=1 Tax=Nonomuraea bangladeshensis TaxID=404385 RepID=UPI003C2FD1B6
MRIVPLVDPEPTPSSRRLAWLATLPTGAPAGSAFLRLYVKAGQDHLAELDLHVHPAEQRKGVGSLLLDAAVEAARQERRRSLTAQAEPGSPAEAFLAARGSGSAAKRCTPSPPSRSRMGPSPASPSWSCRETAGATPSTTAPACCPSIAGTGSPAG